MVAELVGEAVGGGHGDGGVIVGGAVQVAHQGVEGDIALGGHADDRGAVLVAHVLVVVGAGLGQGSQVILAQDAGDVALAVLDGQRVLDDLELHRHGADVVADTGHDGRGGAGIHVIRVLDGVVDALGQAMDVDALRVAAVRGQRFAGVELVAAILEAGPLENGLVRVGRHVVHVGDEALAGEVAVEVIVLGDAHEAAHRVVLVGNAGGGAGSDGGGRRDVAAGPLQRQNGGNLNLAVGNRMGIGGLAREEVAARGQRGVIGVAEAVGSGGGDLRGAGLAEAAQQRGDGHVLLGGHVDDRGAVLIIHGLVVIDAARGQLGELGLRELAENGTVLVGDGQLILDDVEGLRHRAGVAAHAGQRGRGGAQLRVVGVGDGVVLAFGDADGVAGDLGLD